MNLIQNSNFRVQGMFFQQLYWEKSKQDTLWRGHFWIPILSGHHTSTHICNQIRHKKLQYNLPKMRRGSKAVWNFSENSSDLVAGPFPKCIYFTKYHNVVDKGGSQTDPKVITMRSLSKWSPSGNQLIPELSPSGCQFNNWSPSGHPVIPTWPTSCHQMIPNWSQIDTKLVSKWPQIS